MAEVKNCLLPDDLRYHVQFNVWLRGNGDGTFDLGMTDIAQTLAGSIIHCRPKKAGKQVKQGRSVATVESGKWVGPVKSPVTAEIVARNDAVEADATLLNRSPYKEGWIVRLKPVEGAEGLEGCIEAPEAIEGFSAYMDEHDLGECIHCEGFEG
ncbi:MAG: glycine cleavage system protein H [Acidobacteriota bacterium]|nr:glycine cleavage system protein H [Acidobacteriota bacterium]